MVGNVLIFSPLRSLFWCLFYASILWIFIAFSLLVGQLYFANNFIFGEWIPLSLGFIFLSLLAGNGLGHLFYHLRKKRS